MSYRIGDGVGLLSEGGAEANGTVVDFVYAAHDQGDPDHVRVYWRTSGSASDHRKSELVRLISPEAEAWQQGFTACQLRVSQQLLALLPQQVHAENPYD
ncbi:hypothetical protein [Mycolicibacterium septicum]|uniref:hypothetical protein n=1 Tax=Mycolicibacterium septicum TaxID=98668 RepID=UPI001AF4E9C3|nr:hypothetical protein [Mycolicibacterium septicum]QRY51766.1 hypothetical protein JVX95_31070 [Mycolicibacterium septicum]